MQKQAGKTSVVIWLIVIVCAAVAARLVWSLHVGGSAHLGDEFVYDTLAKNLVNGKGFTLDGVHPSAYKNPGLPAVMALLYTFFGCHLIVVRVFQSLVGGATVLLAYSIAAAIGHRRSTGLLAAVGVAIYPYYIFAAGSVYPVVFATFLIALSALLIIKGANRKDGLLEGLSGLVFGLTLLCFPHVVFAAGLVAIWILVNKAADRRRRAVAALLFIVLLSVPVVPWIARNKVVLGRACFSTVYWASFWAGNAPDARWDSGSEIENTGDPAIKKRAVAMSETAAADLYRQEGLKEVKQRPGRFVLLSLGKAVNFWRFYPNLQSRPLRTSEKLVGIASYGPVLLLAIYGLVVDSKRRRYNYLLLAYPLATMVPIAFTCSQDRYRMPFDIYLIIIASAALIGLVTRWRSHLQEDTLNE